MPRLTKEQTGELERYIIHNLESHPVDIAKLAAAEFRVSRQTIFRHLQKLTRSGVLEAKGNTKARRYELKLLNGLVETIQVTPELEEHVVWRDRLLPLFTGVPSNVVEICNYGFTEMLNNVKDHSASKTATIKAFMTASKSTLIVQDFGIGIFKKLQEDFQLFDPRQALLELCKGKLTSDEGRHTGEGIFFSSRMFDQFIISSDDLSFCRFNRADDWLLTAQTTTPGTVITMEIFTNATQTQQSVYEKFTSEHDDFGFTKTHVPIQLSLYEGEKLVSRSQAKRLLARFDRFKEVILDFKGVASIGQAFADEVFRVYRLSHPNVDMISINATDEVLLMVRRAEAGLPLSETEA